MTIYLAGGCFWGTQKFFDQFDGGEQADMTDFADTFMAGGHIIFQFCEHRTCLGDLFFDFKKKVKEF